MRRFSYPGDIYNATPARVVFGPGSAAGAKAEVARLGATRALVISTPGRGALAESVAANLDELGVGLLDEAVPQVPIELAVKARAKASAAGADCLVSVGGGSATGLAKAIALDLALPIVAIPTTYAGSEMTGFCGITIDGVKRMHTSLRMVPSTVVYDAELSVSLPPSVSAASAMNGLAHCVDAIYLPHLSPLLAHAAVEGAKVIATQIPRMLSDPRSLDTRNELLYGAYLGGAALTSGYALQHDLAHALGGSLGIEHGLAHALVLPHVAAYNQRFAPQALGRIAEALDTDNLGGALFDLLERSGLPTRLSEVGMDENGIEHAVQVTTSADSGHGVNPGPVTGAVVRGIVRRAYAGQRPD